VKIVQTPTFTKQSKKLYNNQKRDLDSAVKIIMANPLIGEMKKGDLNGIQVYKFKMVQQLTLLAYEWHKEELLLVLLALGSHENFYRDLKN
jgi:mRNA-degrading endonuclease YafQ of YafQ-DinJ toxin-antitoxin module